MRYQLGIIVDGRRVVAWQGNDFPPFGMHDTLSSIAKFIREICPEKRVEFFHECDGKSYGY